jgi:hypothetical protein
MNAVKKIFIPIALGVLFACGGEDNSVDPIHNPPIDQSVCPVTQFWKSDRVTGDTIVPVEGQTRYYLWKHPNSHEEVIEVKQVSTGIIYEYPRDYYVERGGLQIPLGSTIPRVSADFLITPDPTNQYISSSFNTYGGRMRISDDYPSHQISVTYLIGRQAIEAPNQPATLPNYERKLAALGMPKITFFGDDITGGSNASDGKSFVEIITSALKGRATVRSKVVPGWSASTAKYYTDTLINDQLQDVVVLGFGMEDALGMDGEAEFKSNISAIIGTVRSKAPDTEFVLVSGMRGNTFWRPMRADAFSAFRVAMHSLAYELPGVVFTDVTSTWDDLAGARSYYDVSGNGANRPGDFVHGIYADHLLRSLGPAGCR